MCGGCLSVVYTLTGVRGNDDDDDDDVNNYVRWFEDTNTPFLHLKFAVKFFSKSHVNILNNFLILLQINHLPVQIINVFFPLLITFQISIIVNTHFYTTRKLRRKLAQFETF